MTRKAKTSKKLETNSKGNARGMSEASRSNLIPGANKNGRPKGKLNFDTRIDMAINVLAEVFVKQHNAKLKNKNNQITVDDVDIEGDVFLQYMTKARNGEIKYVLDFMDRRHGKAVQQVQHGSIPGDPLVEAQIKAAEADIEAWERQWEGLGIKSGNKKHGDSNTHTGTKGTDKHEQAA